MRTTQEMIIHNWANDPTYSKQLSSLNVFASDGTIYSYGRHFPMAKWFSNKKGERAILFTRRTHSVTTRKHLSWVRRAIPSNVPVFYVPGVSEFYGVKQEDQNTAFKTAFQTYIEEANNLFAKASRSRTYGESYIREAQGCLESAKAFSSFFKLGFRTPNGANPEVVEKIINDQKESAKKAREAEKKRQHEKRKKDALDFQNWQNGFFMHGCPASYRQDENGSAYLRTMRYEDDRTDEVQTSQGACVPLSHAVRAFSFIKLCRMTGQAFEANGKTVRVGNFQVRKIEANGETTIGCHFLTWERLEEWARMCGIFEEPASPLALETITENAC